MALGLPLRTMEHESGPGQLETTFSPDAGAGRRRRDAAVPHAGQAVLRATRLSRVVHDTAAPGQLRPERLAPAPVGHEHEDERQRVRGRHGAEGAVSPEGEAYVEGLLARAREFCLLSVPTVNGYRGSAPEFTLSPTLADWRFEDRSVMVRVLSGGSSTHVENRIGEPCANPYLAIASQLSAGLDGLAAEPSAPARDHPAPDHLAHDYPPPDYPALPRSLREALDAFSASSTLSDLLGDPLKTCLRS